MAKTTDPICGIIMPISKVDEQHDERHWSQVKGVLERAIVEAGCTPQPVWEGAAHDIIQAKILQNLFENELAVCDMSTRNPNVMLEVGMRLTTKKPTLLVAEKGTDLPFDTGIIHTEFYDKSLQFAGITKFIETLSGQIREKWEAFHAGNYKPYIEAFEFETVEPPKRSVSSVEHLTDLISKTNVSVAQLEKLVADRFAANPVMTTKNWVERAKDLSERESLGLNPVANALSNEASHRVAMPEQPVGAGVYHAKFGFGDVVSVDGHKVSVNFGKDVGVKRVLDSFLDWDPL